MCKRLGKILCCAFFCVVTASCAVPKAFAVSTSASSAILMEASSGRVLYAQNADEKMLIASTTKIMTALVALESCAVDDVVEIQQSHMVEGSSMYLKPGEKLTLETLLYGLMLCSGNDAALAVADHCGPGVAAFVAKMNDKAAALGMLHSSFANPNGLDDENHYSTARDMATLAAYAMENETFARIVSTQSITIGGCTMQNHNKLLAQYEGCIGLKTGYTRAAGRTLVSCAVQDGMKLIAVTLKDGNDWADHAALYDYGFATYHMEDLARAGEIATAVSVLNGVTPTVPLCYQDSFAYPVREGEEIGVTWDKPSCVFAPVLEGNVAGNVCYTLNNEEIGSVLLDYSADTAALPTQQRSRGAHAFLTRFLKSC